MRSVFILLLLSMTIFVRIWISNLHTTMFDDNNISTNQSKWCILWLWTEINWGEKLFEFNCNIICIYINIIHQGSIFLLGLPNPPSLLYFCVTTFFYLRPRDICLSLKKLWHFNINNVNFLLVFSKTASFITLCKNRIEEGNNKMLKNYIS